MSITVSRRYGDSTISVEANSLAEALEGFKEIDELPTTGRNGGDSSKFQLRCRHTRDYQFYEVIDPSDGYTFKLGVRKDDKKLFPKRDEGEGGWCPPYQGKGGDGGGRRRDRDDDSGF